MAKALIVEVGLAKAPPTPSTEARAGARVALVVEDALNSAQLIQGQLEAEGFKVLHAASGAAALMEKPISRQKLHESLADLRLIPLSQGHKLKVLVVDDDPKAVELIVVYAQALASTVLRAYGGREAIDVALRELPDVIVLDLMMPDVTGFDVVAALTAHPDTARIPILIVTAKVITAQDRAMLSRSVKTIMETAGPDTDRFRAEVRRAMSGRPVKATHG